MRKNFIIEFKSNQIYFNLDFNEIKRQLKYKFRTWQDCNSIFIVKYNPNIFFTVDTIGDLTIYYFTNDKYNIKYIENIVLKIIQDQVPSFKYIK